MSGNASGADEIVRRIGGLRSSESEQVVQHRSKSGRPNHLGVLLEGAFQNHSKRKVEKFPRHGLQSIYLHHGGGVYALKIAIRYVTFEGLL